MCPACTDIDAGRFVDYTELDAASNRGVDEVPGQRSHVDTERRPVGLVDVDRLRLDAFQLVVSPIAHEGAPSVDRAASTAASSL